MSTIFTVGHSRYKIEYLIKLITKHKITAIADVRSIPYSRINPQFNKESLQSKLRQHGIAYVFLGKELGARPEDQSCYINGKVSFDAIMKTALFRQGIKRLLEGMEQYKVSLLCSEKDPIYCHRTILVSKYIYSLGLTVYHIHEDSHLESHEALIERLLRMYDLEEEDFFMSRDERVERAFTLQEGRIAHDNCK